MSGKESGSIRTNLKWSFLGNYGGQLIGFFISIILARLLSPEDFGLFGLSLALINILSIFMTMGLTEALVQNKNAVTESFNAVFFVNVFFGVVGSLLLIVFAPYVSLFYGKPEVTLIIRLLAAIFFIDSLTVTQNAYLKKKMAFKKLTTRILVAQFIGGCIALIAAFNDFGVYALIIQRIIINLIKGFLLWSVSDWKPKIQFDFTQIKMLQKYAIYTFSSQAVGKLIKETTTLSIAKFFNPIILGFFSKANNFSNLIVSNSSNSLRVVFFSKLSAIQDEHKKFHLIFIKIFELVLVASVLFSGLAFINAELLILGLLGEKWEPTIIIFKWLLIRGLTTPINGIIITALLSKGLAKENFLYGNVRHVILLLSFVSLIFRDLELFLIAYSAAQILITSFNLFLSKKYLNLNFKTHFLPLLLNSLLSISVVLMLDNFIVLKSIFLESIVQSILFLGFLFVFQYSFNRSGFNQVYLLLKKTISKYL